MNENEAKLISMRYFNMATMRVQSQRSTRLPEALRTAKVIQQSLIG